MELEIIKTVLETLGPAAAAFTVMYLWLKAVRKDLENEQEQHTTTRNKLDQLQSDRVEEMQRHVQLLESFKRLISEDREIPNTPR